MAASDATYRTPVGPTRPTPYVSSGRTPIVGLAAGIATGTAVALVLSRTRFFRGPTQSFVLELPGWRWPRWQVVLERVREAVWSFLQNAGTLIVAVSILIWALASYPRNEAAIEADVAAHRDALEERLAAHRGFRTVDASAGIIPRAVRYL